MAETRQTVCNGVIQYLHLHQTNPVECSQTFHSDTLKIRIKFYQKTGQDQNDAAEALRAFVTKGKTDPGIWGYYTLVKTSEPVGTNTTKVYVKEGDPRRNNSTHICPNNCAHPLVCTIYVCLAEDEKARFEIYKVD